MSVYLLNSVEEEEEDSPSQNADSNNAFNPDDMVEPDYGELTIQNYWPTVTEEIRKIHMLDVRIQALPLARIKKIMKLDEDVKMISAEAPVLFAKAAELFIMELTLRSWLHTEDNKRRTLQRSDIAMAISKYDQFDFLIDIVPREEAKMSVVKTEKDQKAPQVSPVQYYAQVSRLQSPAVNQTTATISSGATIQMLQPSTGQIQTVAIARQPTDQNETIVSGGTTNLPVASGSGQIIQIPNSVSSSSNSNLNGIQLVQQIITPQGEVQHIPVILQVPAQQRRK